MGITVYPSPNFPRLGTYATTDSQHRLFIHGAITTSVGVDTLDCLNSQPERYDPVTGAWTVLANPPKKLFQFAWILDSQDRYIGAGWVYETLGTCADVFNIPDSFMYDPATDSWTTLAGTPYINGDGFQPPPILVSAWKYGDQLYIHENVGPNVTRPFLHFTGGPAGTWASGVATPTNQTRAVSIGNAHGSTNPVGANGLFLFTTGPSPLSNAAFTYNPLTDTYSVAAAPSPSPGSTGESVLPQWDGSRYLHLIGGGPGLQDSARYDSLTDTWSYYPGAGTLVSDVFSFHTGFADISGNFVALFGYQTADRVQHPNILVYDFTLGQWLDTGDALSILRLATPVYDPIRGGVYLIEGPDFGLTSGGTQIMEYWVYNATPPPAGLRGRSWATFIGAD